MTTVDYQISATVKPLSSAPSLPSGYALSEIAYADLQAFAAELDGVKETITGETQTDRMRKLRTRLAAVLDGATSYSGPTDVHVNNSDIGTNGAWTSSAEICVHPRGADVDGDPSVCAAQNASVWQVADVEATEL